MSRLLTLPALLIFLLSGIALAGSGNRPPAVDYHTDPPAEPVRAVAEWEEDEAVLMRWGFWQHDTLAAQMIGALTTECRIYLVVNQPDDTGIVLQFLTSQGVPTDSVFFLYHPTNTVWIRDYGPWWIWRLTSHDRAMVDYDYNRPTRPDDDVFPEWLSQEWAIPYYGPAVTSTGGNWMVDGYNQGFCTALILDNNPTFTPSQVTQVFRDFYDLDTTYIMPAFIGGNHLDMYAKLLNDHTVLINQYPDGYALNAYVDQAAQVFSQLTNRYGQPFEVVRVMTPVWEPDRRNYANALIVNRKVLVPVYNLPTDSAAIEIYKTYMPGYRIATFDCNLIIPQSGTVHCIAKDVMHRHLISIEHQPPSAGPAHFPYRVAARITSLGTLDLANVILYWKTTAWGLYNQIPMVHTTADSFSADIPAVSADTVYYYIYAKNLEGNWTTIPRWGPEANYRLVTGLEVPPVPDPASPFSYHLEGAFPNPFNPVTTIRYELRTAGFVSLKVYDITGKLVASLVNGWRPAGKQEVTFDASGMSAGLYFYRITAGQWSASGKLALVK